MNTKQYSFIEHTADLGIVVRGKDLKDLFETSAMALMSLLVAGNPKQEPSKSRIIVSADDTDDLMVRWLSEILYLFAGDGEVVTDVNISQLLPTHLEAVIKKVPFDPDRHEIQHEIKAVTYHQISVSEKKDHWEARIILDV
jgi:SHS2 domain-containing protein